MKAINLSASGRKVDQVSRLHYELVRLKELSNSGRMSNYYRQMYEKGVLLLKTTLAARVGVFPASVASKVAGESSQAVAATIGMPSSSTIKCICMSQVAHGKIVQCGKCKMSQHPGCFGYQHVSQIPKGPWICHLCRAEGLDPMRRPVHTFTTVGSAGGNRTISFMVNEANYRRLRSDGMQILASCFPANCLEPTNQWPSRTSLRVNGSTIHVVQVSILTFCVQGASFRSASLQICYHFISFGSGSHLPINRGTRVQSVTVCVTSELLLSVVLTQSTSAPHLYAGLAFVPVDGAIGWCA